MTNPMNFLQQMLQRTMGRPAAAAAAPAPAEPEVSKAYVLTGAGGGRFDQIYAGVVGNLDAQGKFAIHPDYKQVAYLFSLVDASSIPAAIPGQAQEIQVDPLAPEVTVAKIEHVLEVQLPAASMKAFRASMIDVTSRRWGSLYESVAAGIPGGTMVAQALQAEAATTARNVQNYIAAAGLRHFDVPVLFDAHIAEENPAQRGATEAEVLAMASGASNITLLPYEWSDGAPVDSALNAEQAEENEAANTGALPAQWLNHQGPMAIKAEGHLKVLAGDAKQAHDVASAMLKIAHAAPHLIGEHLKPVPHAIQSAQLLEPEGDDDADGDDYRWGETYRG